MTLMHHLYSEVTEALLTKGATSLQVVALKPEDAASRGVALHRVRQLLRQSPHSQKLHCFQAMQETNSGSLEKAAEMVAAFADGAGAVPCHWALHMQAHQSWLKGDIEMVCCFALTICTNGLASIDCRAI